jgi:hypothetical protein
MTQKARKIIEGLRGRFPPRLGDLKSNERVLNDFNRDNLDDVGPVAGASGNRFLQEINEMQNLEHDQQIEDIEPKVAVY